MDKEQEQKQDNDISSADDEIENNKLETYSKKEIIRKKDNLMIGQGL